MNVQRVKDAAWVIAVGNGQAEAERSRVGGAREALRAPTATSVPSSGSLEATIACIYAHESGDYTESSHPNSGSGAAQFIPSTWRTWSIRAGYGTTIIEDGKPKVVAIYAYAYLAPPAVQEAVLRYTLTNGGAGNWSNRFGNDPCTGN